MVKMILPKTQFWPQSGSNNNESPAITTGADPDLLLPQRKARKKNPNCCQLSITLRCHELDLDSHAQTAELFVHGCSCC